MPYRLPKSVRLKAQARGETGRAWMSGLHETVKALANEWQLRVGEVLEGGSESLVLTAELEDGVEAVLKVGIPGLCDCANEARAYRLTDRRGYPSLLKHSESYNAILLERLGSPLGTSTQSEAEQIRIICDTLAEAWVPLNAGHSLTTGAEKARALAEFIDLTWRKLRAPCSEATKELALIFALERQAAYDPENCVLVHGDAHAHNTLKRVNTKDDERSYKFIDPDGLFAEPALDLAIPMREWNEALLQGDAVRLGQRRCERLAARTGVDERAIWQWGFVERVSTGFLMMQVGMEKQGSETLYIAERWSAQRLAWS